MLLRLALLVSILVHLPQNLFAAEDLDLIFQSGFEQTDMLAAPTGLSAIAVSKTRIDLSWTDTTSTETGFGIEHSTDGSNWSAEDTVSANVSAYTDTNLSPATMHYYRVRAFDAITSSSWSNTASATTDEVPPPDPPNAPTGLMATTIDPYSIELNWTDNATTETGFTVEHSTNSVDWSVETSLGPNTTIYTDMALSPATTHYYRVRAFDAITNSSWSNTASATTDEVPPPDPPNAPTGLMATTIDPYSIELNWTDNATIETGFTVEHSANSVDWSVETSLGPNTSTYTDTALSPATTHYYRVRAFDAITNSTWSNTASAITDEEPPPSYVPAALVAIAIDSNNIELSWVDNSNNETGFKIRRRVTFTGYITVGYVAANTTTFVSTNLRPETKYFYQVFAYNADGDSAGSNIASATTPP